MKGLKECSSVKGWERLKRVAFEDISELARRMIQDCSDIDDCSTVNTVCHFEFAAELTEELIKQGCKISWAGYT